MLGLTRQEQQIVLFLTVSLLIGSSLKIYKMLQPPVLVTPVPQGQIEGFRAQADSLQEVGASHEPSARAEVLSTDDQPADSHRSSRGAGESDALLVAINLAGEEELQTIPGIGPVLARRILAYRTEVGAFGKIEELKRVKGIGEKTFEKIKPYVSLKE